MSIKVYRLRVIILIYCNNNMVYNPLTTDILQGIYKTCNHFILINLLIGVADMLTKKGNLLLLKYKRGYGHQ